MQIDHTNIWPIVGAKINKIDQPYLQIGDQTANLWFQPRICGQIYKFAVKYAKFAVLGLVWPAVYTIIY